MYPTACLRVVIMLQNSLLLNGLDLNVKSDFWDLWNIYHVEMVSYWRFAGHSTKLSDNAGSHECICNCSVLWHMYCWHSMIKMIFQYSTIVCTHFTTAKYHVRFRLSPSLCRHYNDVIMSAMVSQITGVSIVCSTVYFFRRRSKKASKLRVTSLCAGNSLATNEFPAQKASNAENVSIWWRHRGNRLLYWHTIRFVNPNIDTELILCTQNEFCRNKMHFVSKYIQISYM